MQPSPESQAERDDATGDGASSAGPDVVSDVVTGVVGVGLAAVLALHFFEPDLGQTWSYAHLSRAPALPWLAAIVVVLLPLLAVRLLRLPAAGRALAPLPRGALVAGGVAAFAVLLPVGLVWPAPSTSFDANLFLGWVSHDGDVARWHLLLKGHRLVAALLAGAVEPVTAVRATNAALAGVALAAIVASARALARTRGEAFALALLSVSSFGVLQLCIGYADVYPLPLAATALYVATGLAAMSGRGRPLWPFALAAVGPFFYVGLVLLAPSAVVVAVCALRGPHGPRRVAVGAAVAVALAGAATLPRFGGLFAFGAFLDAIDALPATHMGQNPDGYALPLAQILSVARLEEVAHLLLLVDPVGWVLIAGTTAFAASRAQRGERATLAFLGLLVAPYVAFVFAMEPLYGAYGDWDLFSYGAVATSLLGGASLVAFGRAHPARFRLLLGVALACASVHLLARLHALDVDAERHRRESPLRIEPARAGPGPAYSFVNSRSAACSACGSISRYRPR